MIAVDDDLYDLRKWVELVCAELNRNYRPSWVLVLVDTSILNSYYPSSHNAVSSSHHRLESRYSTCDYHLINRDWR